ncbi:MAG: aminoacetone oxidase family FAD-binding enzyme [Candidatus Magasanikbacteria bacterium]|nr:aminoacetone oxidase family FAD-binding enzyme [Candidatus Magasanikbacteria bacterium]
MKIAIIGGGAAGLMTAATITEQNTGAEIFLIEQNTILGKKVLISGGGRCNVTTGIRNIRFLFTRYPRGSKFLSSALYGFPPEAVYGWFESHGVPLKIEEDLRVFPVSNNGQDIVGAFEKLFSRSRVKILLSHSAKSISYTDGAFTIEFRNSPTIVVDKVIITTGGQTFRQTGSTGDGYTFAETLGHTITPLAASLSSFISRDEWLKSLAGVSFEAVGLRTDRIQFPTPVEGAMLITHSGITGPAVFAFSALAAYEIATPKEPLTIFINLFPGVTSENFLLQVKSACAGNAKRTIENAIATLVPKSVAKMLCAMAKIEGERHAAEVSKKELEELGVLMQNLPVRAIGRGAGDEFVTAGGVNLSEVNPSTMESRITRGLFFAGEILDIDGFTGGFNLQASWATGRLAGLSAAK